MKKLKTFLCMGLVAVAGCLGLVGCGPNKPSDSGNSSLQTITISQAQQYLTDGLKVNGVQYANAMEKFGSIYITGTLNRTMSSGSMTQSVSVKTDGWAKYADGKYTNLLANNYLDGVLDSSTYMPNVQEVYVKNIEDGEAVYEYYNTSNPEDSSYEIDDMVLDNFYPIDSQSLALMYTDGGVAKRVNADGSFQINVILDGAKMSALGYGVTPDNFEQLKEEINGDYPGVETYEDLLDAMRAEMDEMYVEVTYYFAANGGLDKLEINSAVSSSYTYPDMESGGTITYTMRITAKMSISAYTGKITAPEWVNEENFPA